MTLRGVDEARVTRGQLAWSRIKATAAEQRELWLRVGDALTVGRRMFKADRQFSLWCTGMGFGDMDRRDRAAAMWYVKYETAVEVALKAREVSQSETPTELTHPRWIQEWYAKYLAEARLPAELKELEVTAKPTVTLDQRSAEKLAKLINRSTSGDEGSETAKRLVENIAKKHGVSSEELKEVI